MSLIEKVIYVILPMVLLNVFAMATPMIDSIVFSQANTIHIYFSIPMDSTSVSELSNYQIQPGNISPSSVSANQGYRKWTMSFSDSFLYRTYYSLSVSQLSDQTGQTMSDTSVFFFRYQSSRNDILFHEIMADPEPSNGLPEVEWIELVNASPFPINMSGWRIGKTNIRSGPLPNFILKPDSFLLVCSSGSLAQMMQYGNCRSVTYFPALSNSADELFLVDDKGKTIHTLSYHDYWHENAVKKSGGWTLEMKDSKNPCGDGYNWSSTKAVSGGTPGAINSIRQYNPDVEPPQLVRCYVSDPNKICLLFDETLDSAQSLLPNRFRFDDPRVQITGASFSNSMQEEIALHINPELDSGKIYTLQYENLEDCVSNKNPLSEPIKFGLKKMADTTDLVINEILFNPVIGGSDMVEVFNRSNQVSDLSDCFLARLNDAGEIDDIMPISENPYPLLPGEHLAITTDKTSLLRDYRSIDPKRILEIDDLPTYSDDEGSVVLLNRNGDVIDKVHYMDSWHFPLLYDTEGVSLERLDPNGVSQLSSNWHSASSQSGFATPGIKNSQSKRTISVNQSYSLHSKWMSPNNDGNEDLLVLHYRFDEPGNVLQAFIFSAGGVLIHRWLKAELCGMSGQFFWNGVLENGRTVGYGAYVLYVESFNADGKIKKEKIAFYVGD